MNPKIKLSKKKDFCRSCADNIYKINPSREQLEDVIFAVFDAGYSEGYNDATQDNKKHREVKEKHFLLSFNRLRDFISDRINSNK